MFWIAFLWILKVFLKMELISPHDHSHFWYPYSNMIFVVTTKEKITDFKEFKS